jgi:uncharacterized protein YbaP (TraB family)
MVWRIEKNGRSSHIVGTAHFFPYSFRRPLTRLIRNTTTAMFEGPLDETSFARIAEYGRQGEDAPTFLDLLTPEAITAIDRILRGRFTSLEMWLQSLVNKKPVYFESLTSGMRPWAAFFAIWRTYLNWEYSVDLEAYHIAHELGREIHFLETIEEQLAVLDNIPMERHARQLNDVSNWDAYKNEYVKTYLNGDLVKLMTLSARFVTRIPASLGVRDQLFFERMKPVMERQDVVACIGFPHVPGVTKHFRDAGYTITQVCL